MSQRGLFYGWVVLAAAPRSSPSDRDRSSARRVLKPLEESIALERSAISTTA